MMTRIGRIQKEVAYAMIMKKKTHFIDLHYKMKDKGLELSRADYWRLIMDLKEEGRVRMDDYNYLHPLPEMTLIQRELRSLLNCDAPQDYIDNLRERLQGLNKTITKSEDERRQIQTLLGMVAPKPVLNQSLRDTYINSAFEYIRLCPQWDYKTVVTFVAAEHFVDSSEVAPYVTVKRFNALKRNAPPLPPLGGSVDTISGDMGASFLDELQDPWEVYYGRDQYGNSMSFEGGTGI